MTKVRAKIKKNSRSIESERWTITAIGIFLVVVTWAVFGQSLKFEFVSFDDETYVTRNPMVTQGLTFRGIGWAFTHSHALNWHPLTTMSHMLDCQLYGTSPAGHHFTNVLIHCASAILLLIALRKMTGRLWESAFVAVLFAIHPLRAESVAWVAERKDVLSGLFFMLTLLAYESYVRRPPSLARYLRVILVFALGLLSKPMLVTMPFVLLLLDYWPLKRCPIRSILPPKTPRQSGDKTALPGLFLEKVPLLVLSVASCAATLMARGRPPVGIAPLPLTWRIDNALISYIIYVWDFVWPAGLAAFYPYPYGIERTVIILPFLLLVLITGLVTAMWRTRPYALVGWYWYLIMLLPVIGIVQSGPQGHADRYTYLPQIGLCLVIVGAVSEWARAGRWRRGIVSAAGVIAIAIFASLAHAQVSHWRNSVSLWEHALAVTVQNDTAHNNLGVELFRQGRVDEAITHYKRALEIAGDIHARYNVNFVFANVNLGNALLKKGRRAEAVMHYQTALQIQPDYADAHYNLGTALLESGDADAAILEYEKSLALRPEDPEAETSLANGFLRKGDDEQAIAHYERALQIAPDYVSAQVNLALVLATCSNAALRDGPRALTLALRANELSGGKDPLVLAALAAAYEQNHDFPMAWQVAQKGLELAVDKGNSAVAGMLRRSIARCSSGAALAPVREPNAQATP